MSGEQWATMLIERGDVVRVLFPNSDLTTAKRRPALVIQADSLNTGLAQTVIDDYQQHELRGQGRGVRGNRACGSQQLLIVVAAWNAKLIIDAAAREGFRAARRGSSTARAGAILVRIDSRTVRTENDLFFRSPAEDRLRAKSERVSQSVAVLELDVAAHLVAARFAGQLRRALEVGDRVDATRLCFHRQRRTDRADRP